MRTKTTCLLLALAAAWAFADEDPATREHQFFRTYGPSPLFKDNSFVGETVEDKALPDAEAWKTRVPRAVWDGHPREVAAFADAWRMVGEKLHKPEEFWGTSPAKGLKNKGFLGPCPHRIPTGYMLLPAPGRLAHYHRIYINAVVCHIHRPKVASPSEVDRVVTPRAKFMV